MNGWLIVNSFLKTTKFQEIYALLARAAHARNVVLDMRTASSLTAEIGGFAGEKLPDFVLFWDKDVFLARRLEALSVPLFNSASAVEICDNKMRTCLALNGRLPMPKTVFAPKTFEGVNYSDLNFLKKAGELLGFPMVIKEACGSFGQQVYLARSLQEAEKMVQKLGSKEFLMQEYADTRIGTDLRVNVVGDEAVCAILRRNERDFRSNISNGGEAIPYDLNAEQKALAVAACKAVGADFAGVDLLFAPGGKMLVCEVNSNPHFKSSLDCTGVDLSEHILDHIMEKLS